MQRPGGCIGLFVVMLAPAADPLQCAVAGAAAAQPLRTSVPARFLGQISPGHSVLLMRGW